MATMLKKPIPIEEFNQTSDIPTYQIDGKVNLRKKDIRTGDKERKQLTKLGYKCTLFQGDVDATYMELYFFKTATFDDVTKEINKVKKLLDPRKLDIQFLNISIIVFR